jgi:hypothetical protein
VCQRNGRFICNSPNWDLKLTWLSNLLNRQKSDSEYQTLIVKMRIEGSIYLMYPTPSLYRTNENKVDIHYLMKLMQLENREIYDSLSKLTRLIRPFIFLCVSCLNSALNHEIKVLIQYYHPFESFCKTGLFMAGLT